MKKPPGLVECIFYYITPPTSRNTERMIEKNAEPPITFPPPCRGVGGSSGKLQQEYIILCCQKLQMA